MTYISHITRWIPGKTPSTTLCGSTDATFGVSKYGVSKYYEFRDKVLHWCPECVALLTPLDELANTEL